MVSTVVQFALLLCVTFQTPPTWPPEPNFERPVDYFAWYERWVAGADGLEANAYAEYLRLCPQIATFDPTQIQPDDPSQFPNDAGPMSEGEPEPRPWSAGSNLSWTAAIATNAPHLAPFAAAAREPFVLTPAAMLRDTARLGLGAYSFSALDGITSPLVRARWAFIHAMWLRDGEFVNEHKFLDGIETLLEVSRQLDRSGNLIGTSSAIRVRRDTLRSAETALDIGVLGRDSHRKLLTLLNRLRPADELMSRTETFDCAYAYDMAQRLARASRAGGDADLAATAGQLKLAGYSPERLAREMREYYERIAPLVSLPMRRARIDEMTRLHAELRTRPYFEHFPVIEPHVAVGTHASSTMRYDGLRLVVALHVYRDWNGEWPEALDLLVKSKMVESKIDPLSGEPFVYRIEDGQPLLYSIGADAKDEGGKHNSRAGIKYKEPIQPGDYVIWPLERRGKQ